MAFIAKHRYARITARKARLIVDLIRNKPVGEALDLLKFSKKRAAVFVGKVLKSAIANADAQEADVEALIVTKSFCDDAPMAKRIQHKDRGKAHTILKRSCHITIEVDEGTVPSKKKRRPSGKAKAAQPAAPEAASAGEAK